MTTKQLRLAQLAETKNLPVRTDGAKLYIELPTRVISITATGNKHTAWLLPKGLGWVGQITLTEATQMIGRAA